MVTGLSKNEVDERIAKKQVNNVKIKTGKSIPMIIFSNVFTYFNLIFTVLAVLVFAVGSYKNLSFMVVVLANTVIGIYQEIKAKSVLDKMTLLNSPHTTVIRDGEKKSIPSSEIVLDDMIFLQQGAQIPADCKVVEGKVSVNESLLTGEQDEIVKEIDASLMSGSFIVSGECIAKVTAVGADSYISKLSIEAKKINNKEKSEMVKSVDLIIKIAGIIIIPIGIILLYQNIVINNHDIRSSVTTMVAAVIGMIPEGLYLLLTIALASGSVRLAKQNVLLHDMKSMESLARVDVFCVDKTGTITKPEMTVDKIVYLNENEKDKINEKLKSYVNNSKDSNATMKALSCHIYDLNINSEVAMSEDVVPFSSKYKLGAITYTDEVNVFGAPEFVLGDKYNKYIDMTKEYTDKGERVLVFTKQKSKFDIGSIQEDREPLCFIVLSNPIRENAKTTFSYFKDQGVTIKVISGDNPLTVSKIAIEAGIENADKYVDATTLDTEEKINEAVENYTVFGRVTPEQKRLFVLALKKLKHTVAMTGDGVNDILAMKAADCSIAMASGSEAASQCSKLVLLDSDFSHMPDVVAEGRRVVNNIKRSSTLFLVKNIMSLILSINSIIILFKYPLKPTHLTLISAFTIGLPGMLLAFEPNNNRIKGSFIKDVLIAAFPAGVADAIVLGTIAIIGTMFGIEDNFIGTSSIIVITIIGFCVLYNISVPFSKYRKFVFVFCIVSMIAVACILPNLFDLENLDRFPLVLTILFAFGAESLYRNLSIITNKVIKKEE